jgi:hypothetical protein
VDTVEAVECAVNQSVDGLDDCDSADSWAYGYPGFEA